MSDRQLKLRACTVDLVTGELHEGREGRLTERERSLLAYLVAHPLQPVSRAELAQQVFGYAKQVRTRAVDKAMYNLRGKVEWDRNVPDHLLTRHGTGYVFVPLGTAEAPAPEATVDRCLAPRLPEPRGAFVGREAELAALREAVGEARLVTVVGMGGTGKTRLALALAAEFPTEVRFCDLTQTRTRDGVLYAMAAALGVMLGPDPAADVARALGSLGSGLVVVDNAEGVVAHLRELLDGWSTGAPDVHFVATSREPVGLPGERQFLLDPMIPDDAQALYLQCAEMVRPGLTLSAADQRALPALLEVLDRLPLAIELAGARVRVLTPARLLARLTDRFQVLVRRGGTDRHASLEATFDWSWELLSEAEQHGLAQLSVFEGGFSLEAAEAVLDVDAWPADVVQGLVDRSWLRDAAGRYTMLVSVQDYVRRKLTDVDLVQQRHAAHFAALGAPARTDGRWLHPDTLQADLDNLVVACRWSVGAGHAEYATGALLAAWAVFEARGPYAAWGDLAELTTGQLALPPDRRAAIGWRWARLLDRMGRRERAATERRVSLDAIRSSGRRHVVEARLLSEMGMAAILRGQLDEARPLLIESIDLARAVGHRAFEGNALANLGNLHLRLLELDDAHRCYQGALVIHREVGNLRSQGVVLGNLGAVYQSQGRYDEAVASYEAALVVQRRLGNRSAEALALGNLGSLLIQQGRHAEARQALRHAIDVLEAIGNLSYTPVVLTNLGEVLVRDGETDEARRHYRAALERARAVNHPDREASALVGLGRLERRLGNLDLARRRFREAIEVVRGAQAHLKESRAWVGLATVALDERDPATALDCLDRAEVLLASQADDESACVLWAYRASAWQMAGDPAAARRALDQARAALRPLPRLVELVATVADELEPVGP